MITDTDTPVPMPPECQSARRVLEDAVKISTRTGLVPFEPSMAELRKAYPRLCTLEQFSEAWWGVALGAAADAAGAAAATTMAIALMREVDLADDLTIGWVLRWHEQRLVSS
jgi:hypothetical protein